MASAGNTKKPMAKKNSSQSFNDRDVTLKQNRVLIWVINMLFFSVSVALVIIGIIYLTVYFYEYSFAAFSPTLVAALFIAVGSIVIILSVLNIILTHLNRNRVVLVTSVVIAILYLGLLGIGIWGMIVSVNKNHLKDNVRNGIMYTMNSYDGNNPNKYETLKVDWLQAKYNCCGLYSYNDWRSIYPGFIMGPGYSAFQSPGNNPFNNQQNNNPWNSNQQFNNPWNMGSNNQYNNQWNNLNNKRPYIDTVPDSCCVNKVYNCGKQFANNMMPTSNNRNQVINVRGCLLSFLTKLAPDIVFLAGICFAASVFCTFVFIAFAVAFAIINKCSY